MADHGMPAFDPVQLVRQLYERRRAGGPEALRPLIAADVVWREPEVGGHMGKLIGADTVIDMISRALEATDGSFALRVGETVATGTDCAAVIHWRARKGGRWIEGRELAVYRFEGGLVKEAYFFPENIADDQAFWA